MFAGELREVVALEWILHRPHDALGHVAKQLFPLLQIRRGGRGGNQFAIGPARHGLAVHVADVTTEHSSGACSALVLPVPVADIEGHSDGQLVLLHFAEKALKGFDAASVQGLVVFYQQLHAAVAQGTGQTLQVIIIGKIAQRDFQPFGAEGLGAVKGCSQRGIRV